MTLLQNNTDDWSALHLVLQEQYTRRSVLQDLAPVLIEVVGDKNWFFVDMPFHIGGTTVPGLEIGIRCSATYPRRVLIERIFSISGLKNRVEQASHCDEPWVLSRALHKSIEARQVFADLLALGSIRAYAILLHYAGAPPASIIAGDLELTFRELVPRVEHRRAAVLWSIAWLHRIAGSKMTLSESFDISKLCSIEYCTHVFGYSFSSLRRQLASLHANTIPTLARANHVQAIRLRGPTTQTDLTEEINILQSILAKWQ